MVSLDEIEAAARHVYGAMPPTPQYAWPLLAQQLEEILLAGASAPDHGRMRPWRFVVFEGDARNRLGDLMMQSVARREPEWPQSKLDAERMKAYRAPLVIVVGASVQDSPKVPAIEQIVAAGAAAQNMLLAAHALGFGGFWRTGPLAYDVEVKKALGFNETDAIVAVLYIGSIAHVGKPRVIELESVTRRG